MSELLGRADFKQALRRFLGHGKASWTLPDTGRFEQVVLMLSVSGTPPVRLADGVISLGGCFPHNCPERAQVFLSRAGEIGAVALLYHDCGGKTCTGTEDFTLRILVRVRSPRVEEDARQWAQGELAQDADKFPQFGPYRLASSVVQQLKD